MEVQLWQEKLLILVSLAVHVHKTVQLNAFLKVTSIQLMLNNALIAVYAKKIAQLKLLLKNNFIKIKLKTI